MTLLDSWTRVSRLTPDLCAMGSFSSSVVDMLSIKTGVFCALVLGCPGCVVGVEIEAAELLSRNGSNADKFGVEEVVLVRFRSSRLGKLALDAFAVSATMWIAGEPAGHGRVHFSCMSPYACLRTVSLPRDVAELKGVDEFFASFNTIDMAAASLGGDMCSRGEIEIEITGYVDMFLHFESSRVPVERLVDLSEN